MIDPEWQEISRRMPELLRKVQDRLEAILPHCHDARSLELLRRALVELHKIKLQEIELLQHALEKQEEGK